MLALRELVTGLKDMIAEGRLSDKDIPDDFDWLQRTINRFDLETRDDDAIVVEIARGQYGSDDIEIDDDCVFSRGDDGTWVNGWLWVYDDDVDGQRDAHAL